MSRAWVQPTLFIELLITLIFNAALPLQAAEGPDTPCSRLGQTVSPVYGMLGGPPNVKTWRNTIVEKSETCWEAMQGPMDFVIAISGRFKHGKSLEDIAARFGAISATKGLLYWSTTDTAWRTLISDAFALRNSETIESRRDFDAKEVLSGTPLYFMQDDTRSTGLNKYSLSASAPTRGRLVIRIENVTETRFLFLTLFEPKTLLSVHFIDRLGPNSWGYYGLSAVRKGFIDGNAKSFINRGAAFYRYLAGAAGDSEPPLAP